MTLWLLHWAKLARQLWDLVPSREWLMIYAVFSAFDHADPYRVALAALAIAAYQTKDIALAFGPVSMKIGSAARWYETEESA